MPRDYQEWRQDFGALLMREQRPRYREQPIELELRFDTDGVAITTTPLVEAIRPKHMRRQDIDNLIGGVMEVLEDVHVVDNDKQIYVVRASVLKEQI